jgi:hypothetical protein
MASRWISSARAIMTLSVLSVAMMVSMIVLGLILDVFLLVQQLLDDAGQVVW